MKNITTVRRPYLDFNLSLHHEDRNSPQILRFRCQHFSAYSPIGLPNRAKQLYPCLEYILYDCSLSFNGTYLKGMCFELFMIAMITWPSEFSESVRQFEFFTSCLSQLPRSMKCNLLFRTENTVYVFGALSIIVYCIYIYSLYMGYKLYQLILALFSDPL